MKYKQLQGNQCWVRQPNGILESAVAHEARQNKEGVIRLIYEDGSEHFAHSPDKDLHDFSSWFEVVSFVQSEQEEDTADRQ
jgi:hypothetical protein